MLSSDLSYEQLIRFRFNCIKSQELQNTINFFKIKIYLDLIQQLTNNMQAQCGTWCVFFLFPPFLPKTDKLKNCNKKYENKIRRIIVKTLSKQFLMFYIVVKFV